MDLGVIVYESQVLPLLAGVFAFHMLTDPCRLLTIIPYHRRRRAPLPHADPPNKYGLCPGRRSVTMDTTDSGESKACV